jgi:hypothetical protein
MALQLRRGTNAERLAITPAVGELIYVTNATAAGVPALWVGDGTTAGGYPANDALSQLSDVSIIGTPSDQVPLTYDTATGKWGNQKGLTVYGENNNPTSNSNYINFTGEYIGSGSVDIGWGAGLQFNLEDTAGNIVGDAGEFIVVMTDKTLNAESYKISLEVTHGGSPSIVALETSKTDTKIAGDLTINYDENVSTATIYAKTSGADSTLIWDGTNWTFANPIIAKTSLKLNGSTSNSVTLSAGVSPAVQTYTLPAAYPASNGQILVSTTGGALSWSSSVGTGDVVGPASSTDNAIARFDLATGKAIKNSGVLIDNSNNITIPGDIAVNGATSADITTTTTTATVFNTTAATLNIGGAATTLSIGSGSGTTTVNNSLSALSLTATNGGVTMTSGTATRKITTDEKSTSSISTISLAETTDDFMRVSMRIVRSGTSVQIVDALLTKINTTTALLVEGSNINNGTNLATFTADVSSGTLRLLCTPSSTSSTTYTMMIDTAI